MTSLAGKTVRGGSAFGTQNETLAATLETAAGVIAKKLVEHEGFCYFQVTQGKPVMAAHDPNETGPVPVATGLVTTPQSNAVGKKENSTKPLCSRPGC